MGAFLALLPIFSTLIERLFPDKEKQDEAKIAMQNALNEANAEMYKAQAIQTQAQSDVVTAEINSTSWAAKNWRPWLMLVCISIVANNWIIIPLLTAVHLPIIPTPIPPELWTLVTVGLGGYIGKETISNYSENKYKWNDQKYFDVLKKIFPKGMTQEQVDIINEAKKEASE